MTQMMDLNKMGLAEINSTDLANINGGWSLVDFIIDLILTHPKEVIQGLGAIAEGSSAGSQQNGGIFFK